MTRKLSTANAYIIDNHPQTIIWPRFTLRATCGNMLLQTYELTTQLGEIHTEKEWI